MAESTENSNPDAEAVKVADQIMAEYYEIEERIFKMESIEATKFLIATLKSIIADLESDRVRGV